MLRAAGLAALVAIGVATLPLEPFTPSSTPALATACAPLDATFSQGDGTAGYPWRVTNSAQLANLTRTNALSDDHYLQVNDLDLRCHSVAEWPQITRSRQFRGVYDGGGHTIRHLSIVSSPGSSVGLFSETSRATLRNMTLEAVTVSATSRVQVGALVGYAQSTTVSGVTLRDARISGGSIVGGLIGSVEASAGDSSISDVSVDATVTGAGNAVGVLAAETHAAPLYQATIDRVSVRGSVAGLDDIGGLIGSLFSVQGRVSITEAVSNGVDVTGRTNVGGLIGRSEFGSATAQITVSATASTARVTVSAGHGGGLVGAMTGTDLVPFTIIDSYATGPVVAANGSVTNLGGLVGSATRASYTAVDSFWDTEVSGQSTSVRGTGVSTSAMRSLATFVSAGWDISEGDDGSGVWGLCEGETFPFLRWLPDRPTCTEPAPAVVLPPELEGLINAPVPTTPSTVAPTTEPPVTTPSTTAPEPVSEVVEGTEVVLGGADYTVRLGTNCLTTCDTTVSDNGQPVLMMVPSGSVELTGDGYQPGSSVEVWLFSDPVRLGELTVDAGGNFSGTVPLGGAVPGEHTLRLLGTGADGQPRTLEVAVVVNVESAPVPGPGALPSTGTSTTPLVLAAAAVLLGIGLIAPSRRRTLR